MSPPNSEVEDYLEFIRNFPLNPDPEVFGMHNNAQITTAQDATRNLLLNLLQMQPRAQTGTGKSREEIIGEIAAGLEKQTPHMFDTEMVGKKFPTSYNESMNTVIFQECVRYNRLLSVMQFSLVNVQKALKGEVVMSE